MSRIDKDTIKANRTYDMRYKRPALASMTLGELQEELDAINEAVSDVQWWIDQDDETLLNALDGESDEEWEFRFAFSDLSGKLEELNENFYDVRQGWRYESDFDQVWNDHLVALIGNRYRIVGAYQDVDGVEDYAALTGYEADLAETEAGKRVMRQTKAQMLSTIGQCLGILMAFLDIRQQYDYLKATFDILRDQNTSLLQTIKDIDALYGEAQEAGEQSDKMKQFERLLNALPDKIWVE